MGSEVGLRKGDREGRVGGEIERDIAFAPVSEKKEVLVEGQERRCGYTLCMSGGLYLMTAMLTGAVVLAR